MGEVAISFSSLGHAASKAADTAKKFTEYADTIAEDIRYKLISYGNDRGNISIARTNTWTKYVAMGDQAERFTAYSTALTSLKEECERVDVATKTTVSQLTASFRDAYGIEMSVGDQIKAGLESLLNGTTWGRWLNDMGDRIVAGWDYFKGEIKEWYEYKGGKELITDSLLSFLNIGFAIIGAIVAVVVLVKAVVAIVAVAVTAAAVFAVVAAVAGLIGAGITLVNSIVDAQNAKRAYETSQQADGEYDPERAVRLREMNTVQDTLRKDESLTSLTDDSKMKVSTAYAWATGIDTTIVVCEIINIAKGTTDFVKNAKNAMTSRGMGIKEFAKDFVGNVKKTASNIKTDITYAWKYKNIGALNLHEMAGFKNNLMDEYFNFKGFKTLDDAESTLKSIKNTGNAVLDVFKLADSMDEEFSNSMIDSDFEGTDILKTALDKVILPGLTFLDYDEKTISKEVVYDYEHPDGQFEFAEIVKDITNYKSYTVGDFKEKILDKAEKAMNTVGDITDSWGKVDVLDKLSEETDINIKIPDLTLSVPTGDYSEQPIPATT